MKQKKSNKKSTRSNTGKRKKNNWRKYLALLPTLLWMALIFYMSSKNGEASASMSGKLAEVLTTFFERIRNDSMAGQTVFLERIEYLIRKLAHMTEYGVLFLWICFAVKYLSEKTNKGYQYLLSMLFTFFYACTDEIHQLFVNGRYGSTFDVMIDMIGAVIALLCLLAFQDKKWRIMTGILFAMLFVFVFIYLMLVTF